MDGMAKEKIVEASENNVSGILYKWVNFGKGWRPRWFSLQDGVLSYYKIHGPNKIHAISKGIRIIGEESRKLSKKQNNYYFSDEKRHPKTYGEIYIKISSFKASKSDERKFYIFTGIKTLHLRAETREDRQAWMDALRATKESFQRSWADSVALPESQEIAISTGTLRKRLTEEGLSEEAIRDCEDIMNSEFAVLQQQLRLLQKKNIHLIEKLRQLQAEKMELEAKVVDETENSMHGAHCSGESMPEDCHGTDSDTDEEKETRVEVEADTDEEDDVYFDTTEFLGADALSGQSSFKLSRESPGAGSPPSRSATHVDGANTVMNVVDSSYPLIERRKRLPEPKEIEKSVSLWSLIKDNIGKDLTKVCLPVYFNEPISFLQKCFEDMEYSYLLDRAYEYGKQGNYLMRVLHVAAFAVSGYASSEGRTCKPFNPLLGETYEADYPDKGIRFISEKVSHHPMTIACHCEGRGWVFWGDSTLKSRFWGRSIQLDPIGILTLKFADGEVFQWSKVTTSIYNIILGKLYCEHYGTMHIQGNRQLSCKLKFKEQSIMERNPHQVQGYVHDKTGNKLATLIGRWDESMYFVMRDIAEKSRSYDPMSEAVLLWRKNPPPEFPTRYNLTSFAITLNEITPGLQEKLPLTDSRLRPDQRHLECGEYELANAEKLRLEQNQRQAYRLQEKGWQPRWFKRENDRNTYRYLGGYWEARENAHWEGCPHIFGLNVPDTCQD
ncbi:hypothetical protein SUGI_1015660 [Cryptomeria japonica]|uniref:oxysterol-binding protein-related protein 1C isoform X2 n=1 Tax=Cryptomeria japonica TaxID=3369 RepID=UPI00241497EA|nr:oxysterol-binding protein-related protein 1C isoform X2 [Cryptomeria japonica]GLJ48105.1 hypothetical protein SUGI_1015660 [Cryptomeria japonica]